MQFQYPLPQHSKSVIIIGAGGIVHDAHLPAYAIAGFKVDGIYDIDQHKAKALAKKFNIPKVFENMDDLIRLAHSDVVFDVALPGDVTPSILKQLPRKSAVLMQKPMGNNLAEAKEILEISKERDLLAGVNFQLRYAPYIQAAREMIADGLIGEICDIEINVNVFTPWHLWTFLYSLPRVEILYHSIHYIDLVRSFLGNPEGIFAKTVRHPHMKELASVRTNMILDYGNMIRANILTNHCHDFGIQNQHAFVKIEGTKGAIKIRLGVLINYPEGIQDQFEYTLMGNGKPTDWT
ncbi:MAG TPA: Gfo/Idh/MocA family oxidoreductase, partial [Flavisolibacter sp.]|nr:Gfo/Idh/MocA family oxidoreductase [Flavisolibacter sp.]